MLNKVFLLGRLGKDPEVKYIQSGTAVASFSLATTRTWYTDRQKQQETEWHRVVVWGKLADVAKEYLHKGSLIHVEGRLKTDTWTDRNGTTHYKTQVVCESFQMLDPKNGSSHKEASSAREPGDEPEETQPDATPPAGKEKCPF